MKSLGYWVIRQWLSVLILSALSISSVLAADGVWEQIDVPTHFTDSNGILREPGCSGGPVLESGVLIAADTDFSFFFREGDPKKLVIAWDGGGACWDPNTCVGSAIGGNPIYDLVVDETTEVINAFDGLGELDNPNNPVGDYTQVFIPYCTGDLHTGAKDTEYEFTTPDDNSITWTIHHRGFDNVAAVLTWLVGHYKDVGYPPEDVFLVGASAGGYGVLYAYPAVDELLPWYTRIRVLVDSANGVINRKFYRRALDPEGDNVWGVWDNMAPELVNAFESGPDALAIELNKSLGWNYPHTRFGQYTRAFDAVQIFYYNVARNLNSPELWYDQEQLLAAGLKWTTRARAYMRLSALTTWNYRFYLALLSWIKKKRPIFSGLQPQAPRAGLNFF